MTWVRTDDGAPYHPKLIRAGAEAAWLWHAGLCYSNKHHLDGKLEKDIIAALYPPLASKAGKLAVQLCKVKLWHDRGDHYEIHDYHDYQDQASKEAVEHRREYERDRKREQRAAEKAAKAAKSGNKDDARPPTDAGQCPGQVPDNGGPVPSVTRASPDPSRTDPSDLESGDRGAPPGELVGTAPANQQTGDGRPSYDPESTWEQHAMIRDRFQDGLRHATKDATAVATWNQSNVGAVFVLSTWLDKKQGDPRKLLDRVLKGFFADAYARQSGFPVGLLASNPEKYLSPPKAAPGAPTRATSGRIPPSPGTTGEDFQDDMDFEQARRVARGEIR